MRKFYFLLLLSLTAFVSGIQAQLCNPQFSASVQGNTVLAIPVLTGDSSYQHEWSWGDGTSSNVMNATHTYANCGTYSIVHLVYKRDSIGAIACVDTAIQMVSIICNTPCNIVPNLSFQVNPNQPNVVTFTNTSTTTIGSLVTWNFGDSTTGVGQTVVHSYNQAGVYRVCMRIVINNTCIADTCVMVTVGNPTPVPCNIVANFTNSFNGAPNSMLFISNSSNTLPGDSITWSFGDGTYGYGSSVAHTYTNIGTYTVCLRISRFTQPGTAPCVSEICRNIIITQIPNPCPSTPRFNFNASASNGLVVVFNNITSQNAQMATQWTFGDSTSGTGNTVTHQYQQSGNYWVCMRTTIGSCVYDTCMFVAVTATQPQPCNLQARYSYSNSGSTYSFFNTSTGYSQGDTLRWTFSNGNVTNVQNPVITFQNSGVYRVCLVVKKQTLPGAAPCVSEYCDTIVVSPTPCNFNPNFSATASPTSPNVYQFATTSGAGVPANYTWNFGDGTTGTGYVTSHNYAQSGVYNVCLRVVVNNTCIRDTCRTIVVNTACNMIANFTNMQTPNSNNNLSYTFTNTSIGFAPGDSIRWTFGDSSAPAFTSNPVHVFPRSGYFQVCLRIKKETAPGTLPCVREVCRMVYVSGQPPINCDSVRVRFTMRRDTYMPNRVYFYASSNYFIQRQSWTITRLSDSNSIVLGYFNPMYTFSQTGTYRVCLRANTSGGCVKEYCDTITINAIAQQCVLTAVPNPATTQVSVQATLANANSIYAFIYNSQNVLVGQRIIAGVPGNNLITLNTSNLVSGYYTIRLYHSGQMCLSRFMKL